MAAHSIEMTTFSRDFNYSIVTDEINKQLSCSCRVRFGAPIWGGGAGGGFCWVLGGWSAFSANVDPRC